jgi:hypothetical protein
LSFGLFSDVEFFTALANSQTTRFATRINGGDHGICGDINDRDGAGTLIGSVGAGLGKYCIERQTTESEKRKVADAFHFKGFLVTKVIIQTILIELNDP